MALTNSDYNALPQLANIQGFWRMEEESGTRADLSDNSNTLADGNTVLYGTGKIGNAADFESSNNEYLSIADISQTGLDITGEITILAWIKLESIGVDRAIVAKFDYSNNERAYRLRLNANNKIGLKLSVDGIAEATSESSSTLTTATLYHVGFTLNQTTDLIQIYIAGSADGTATAYTTNIHNSSGAFHIGVCNSTPVQYFDGLIDEVIVWNTCLTDAEVATVYGITTVAGYKKSGASFLHNMMR